MALNLLKKKRFWFTVLVFAALAYWLWDDFRDADLRAMWERMDLWLVTVALSITALMQVARALRWRTIVEPGKKIKVRRAVPLYCAGAALNFMMPALTGQVGRMILFSKKEGLPKTLIFSTFLVEIVFDALMLYTFIVVCSLWFVYPEAYRPVSYVVLGLALALLALLYLQIAFHKATDRVITRAFRSRWPSIYIGFMRFTRSFSKGVRALKSSSHLLRSTLLSVLIWVTHALAIYLLFEAFGFELPLAASIVIVVVNTLAMLLPLTPGNTGTFEVVVVATLTTLYGVNKADAALYAVALHIIDVLPFFVFSIPFMRAERVSLAELERSESEAEAELVRLSDETEWPVKTAEGDPT